MILLLTKKNMPLVSLLLAMGAAITPDMLTRSVLCWMA
jgi:hypothetical protein